MSLCLCFVSLDRFKQVCLFQPINNMITIIPGSQWLKLFWLARPDVLQRFVIVSRTTKACASIVWIWFFSICGSWHHAWGHERSRRIWQASVMLRFNPKLRAKVTAGSQGAASVSQVFFDKWSVWYKPRLVSWG